MTPRQRRRIERTKNMDDFLKKLNEEVEENGDTDISK